MLNYVEPEAYQSPPDEVDKVALPDVSEIVVGLEDIHVLEKDGREEAGNNQHNLPVELGFLG